MMRGIAAGMALVILAGAPARAQGHQGTMLGAYAGLHSSDGTQPVVGVQLTLPLGARFALEPALGGAISDPGYLSGGIQLKGRLPSRGFELYFGAGPAWTRRVGESRFDLAGTAGVQVPGLLFSPGLEPFAELMVSTRHYASVEIRGGLRVRLLRQ